MRGLSYQSAREAHDWVRRAYRSIERAREQFCGISAHGRMSSE